MIEYFLDGNKITTPRMFNVDETSHAVVKQRHEAQKGKHQVGATTSCERAQNVTVVCMYHRS